MTDLLNFPARHQTLYDEIARSHPSLMSGKVWCGRCGRARDVDAAKCLRDGWPRCCGTTVSLEQRNEVPA